MNIAVSPAIQDQLARQRRDRLLQKISTDQRLPSLGIAITEVIKITSAGEESVNKLAKFILSDVGLTKDILNLANSVSYRKSQGSSVTTISKAIFILGFDVVKTSALSMLMLECFSEKYQNLYYELTRSLCSSIIARECVSRSTYHDAEEASIAALFKNIGQVFLAAQEPKLYEEIMQPVRDGSATVHYSAVNHIGCGLPHFGSLILQQWHMPDSIVQAAGVLPFGEIKKSRHRSEWVKQVAEFSSDAAEVIMMNTQFNKEPSVPVDFENEKFTKTLMQKYGAALELDPKILADWLSRAVTETEQLIHKMGMRLGTPNPTRPAQEDAEPDDISLDSILMIGELEPMLEQRTAHPSGKPHNARDLLLAGVMEMTQTIASGKFQLNNLVLQLLEILHGSLGFQFVTAALRDVKTDRYSARISLGQDWHKKQINFNFPGKDSVDLFHLALKNNVDLMIGETGSKKIHGLRPEWHLKQFAEVKSLMILPLIVNGKAIGLIYADRNCEAPEGVPPDETSLIKTMKGQLIAVMSK
ncbi:HD-like signal output (HDOD) protein [Oxalobacteraceae bacterium GrIS 2.11]